MRIYFRQPMFKNVLFAIGIVFLLTGSIFLGIGGAMYMYGQYYRENGIQTEALIEDIRGEDIRIRYETNIGAFTGPLGFYDSSLREGDTVRIYYDPQNPGRIYAASSDILSVVFLSVSVLLLGFGSGLIFSNIIKSRHNRWLSEHGTRIQAKVTVIEMDNSVSSNHRHPFRIICQCKMPDGTVREYLSDPIWYDPEGVLTSDMVDVYIDPENGKRYCVDLSSVLPDEDGRSNGVGDNC